MGAIGMIRSDKNAIINFTARAWQWMDNRKDQWNLNLYTIQFQERLAQRGIMWHNIFRNECMKDFACCRSDRTIYGKIYDEAHAISLINNWDVMERECYILNAARNIPLWDGTLTKVKENEAIVYCDQNPVLIKRVGPLMAKIVDGDEVRHEWLMNLTING